MFNEKKVSRKDFLKCLVGTLFSFLCACKLPSAGISKSITTFDKLDANKIKY